MICSVRYELLSRLMASNSSGSFRRRVRRCCAGFSDAPRAVWHGPLDDYFWFGTTFPLPSTNLHPWVGSRPYRSPFGPIISSAVQATGRSLPQDESLAAETTGDCSASSFRRSWWSRCYSGRH